MVNQTVTDTERNKQLRRIADSLEKIAKYISKKTIDNIVLSNDKITFDYGAKDDEE